MSIETAIESAIKLAEAGSAVFPELANGAQLANDVLDVLNGLHNSAPSEGSMDDIKQAHDDLYKAMTAKGHTLSARLRG